MSARNWVCKCGCGCQLDDIDSVLKSGCSNQKKPVVQLNCNWFFLQRPPTSSGFGSPGLVLVLVFQKNKTK